MPPETRVKSMSDVIKQQDWTPESLRDSGFYRFNRKKQMVLARQLPADEAPLHIKLEDGETLVAHADYMICYHPGDTVRESLTDYHHWPVDPEIFAQTYRDWEDPWVPTPAEQHLLTHGCKAYYKAVGVWAKELHDPVYVQSLEHDKPVLVPEGSILAIGAAGEPYHLDQETFTQSYELPLRERLIKRLVRFFRPRA